MTSVPSRLILVRCLKASLREHMTILSFSRLMVAASIGLCLFYASLRRMMAECVYYRERAELSFQVSGSVQGFSRQ